MARSVPFGHDCTLCCVRLRCWFYFETFACRQFMFTIGDPAFLIVTARVWNDLPLNVTLLRRCHRSFMCCASQVALKHFNPLTPTIIAVWVQLKASCARPG